jgi:pimeloyl-ACP methyl ester carboxylesterase
VNIGASDETIRYRTTEVDGIKVFYREAQNVDAPKLLLLHGFPTAGHMFRELIPLLAGRVHLVAPDLPGFGLSDMPSREKFNYTFDNIARVIERFTEIIGFDRFALYLFDYGAPTGFRMAFAVPSGSRRSSRRTVTPTKRVSAKAGHRSGPTGKTRRKRTERRFALSSHPKRQAGSTRTV